MVGRRAGAAARAMGAGRDAGFVFLGAEAAFENFVGVGSAPVGGGRELAGGIFAAGCGRHCAHAKSGG